MKSLSPKEAIAILSDMKIDILIPKAAVTQRKRNAALDMAISALNCSEIPNSLDYISRQDAIDTHCAICPDKDKCPDRDFICPDRELFRMIKPACPEQQKIGEWVEDVAYYDEYGCPYIITRCNQCGEPNPVSNFCPMCGAKMEGGK